MLCGLRRSVAGFEGRKLARDEINCSSRLASHPSFRRYRNVAETSRSPACLPGRNCCGFVWVVRRANGGRHGEPGGGNGRLSLEFD